MKRKRIGKRSISKAGTDWDRFDRMTDADIERAVASDPDTFIPGPEFWRNARVVEPIRKQPITIRLDSDLLAWLRRQKGYQTEINSILRAYMRARLRRVRGPRAARGRDRLSAAAE